jgi:hypothetical protein
VSGRDYQKKGISMSEQTSKKTGVKSSAQKNAAARYGTQPLPASHQEPGAFGDDPEKAQTATKQPGMRHPDTRKNKNKQKD